jgi:monodechloroaminopyrrolnitrin synthase
LTDAPSLPDRATFHASYTTYADVVDPRMNPVDPVDVVSRWSRRRPPASQAMGRRHIVSDDDALIASRDPLGADADLARLGSMNEAGDAQAIVTLLRKLVGAAQGVEPRRADSLAAMRDLGIVIGSVKRHGLEPVDAVPPLERVLLALAARTEMIPRDTIHHITRWNPRGPRERTYTGQPSERMLGLAVRTSLPPLMAAVDLCGMLAAETVGTAAFAVHSVELAGHLRALENSIDLTTSAVTPEFFGRVLRPYLQEVRVAEASYFGPTAAHLPVSLVDLAVWASDRSTPAYRDQGRQLGAHGVAEWLPLYDEWSVKPSLVTRIADALHGTDRLPPGHDLRVAAEALMRALRSLVVFRGRHFTLARRTYDTEHTEFAQGSAGGDVDLLGEILTLTRANATVVSASLETAGGRSHDPGTTTR